MILSLSLIICFVVFLSFVLFVITVFINICLCGSHINRMYSVTWMIVSLACSPPKANNGYFNILFYFGHFVFTFWSYIYLIRTCMSSKEEQWKFMQTCLPHLISLITFAITLLLDLLYEIIYQDLYEDLHNFMAIEFLLIPPILNPLIYGFKLTKVWNYFLNFVHIKGSSHELWNVDINIGH